MRSRFNFNSLLVFLLSCTLFSCALIKTEPEEEIKAPLKSKTYTSVGYAVIAAQKGDSFDLQLLNAIKVSKLEAYREMAEQVYGILVNAKSNVADGRVEDDLVKSRVKGLVRGARVLKSYHQGDVYITELELEIESFSLF